MTENTIPENWQIKTLLDVGEIVSGGTPSTKVAEYWNGVISWITPADLSGYNEKIIFKGRKSISESGLKKSSSRLIPKGSVLFSSRAPIGYVVIAGNEVCTNQGFKSIVPNKSISSDYLYYFLRASKQDAEKVASGTTFKEISLKAFAQLRIPLPPLPIQLAIVSKIEELLSDLENGRQQLLTAQQQLKVYRQSLLKAAFEGRLNHDSDDLSDKHEKGNNENQNNHKNQDSDNLPKGWKWVKLGDVASKITDGEHITPRRTSTGYYLLSARNIQNGYLALDDVDFIPEDEYDRIIKRCNPEAGDILISCSGSIGRVCRVPLNLKFTMVRSVALVKFDWRKYSSKFYEYMFQSPLLQRQIEKSKKATAQANLFLGPIKNLDIIICPIQEQQQIVDILESKLTVCDKIEETITNSLLQAESLRQSILKKAFEGKLV